MVLLIEPGRFARTECINCGFFKANFRTSTRTTAHQKRIKLYATCRFIMTFTPNKLSYIRHLILMTSNLSPVFFPRRKIRTWLSIFFLESQTLMIVGAAIMAFFREAEEFPQFSLRIFYAQPVLVKRLHRKQANNVFGR